MEKELSSFKSIMKSFMVLIVTALAMGETLALAPDLLKGNQMVASIFEVMDRKTGILGDVGEELKTVEGTIELKRKLRTVDKSKEMDSLSFCCLSLFLFLNNMFYMVLH